MLLVPYPAARVAWLLAMAVCMVGSLRLTWRLISLRAPPKRPDVVMLLAGLVIARFAVNDLAHGQVNWLISFLLLLAMLRAEEERPWHAGLFLGLALVIKPTAWLLVPFYALARRDLKLMSACALTGLVLLLLPGLRYGPSAYYEVCADWPRLMEFFTRQSAINPDNASLVGTLTRYGAGVGHKGHWEKILLSLPLPEAIRWARGLSLVLIGGLFALLCWRRGRSAQAPALVLVLGTLLSPVTWKAHLVLLLLPAAWLGKRLCERPTRGGWIGLSALLALLLLPSRGLLDLSALEDRGGLTAGILLLGLLAVRGSADEDAAGGL